MMEVLDKLAGSWYGLAVGDALGATLEFMDREEIKRIYGVHKEIIGGGLCQWLPGQITDDTEMSIAVALGLIDDYENPVERVGQRFVEWYSTNPKDIGITIRSVISDYLSCGNWLEASQRYHKQSGGKSAGNGSLMRTVPIALAYHKNPEKMVALAMQQSKLTHWDHQAGIACVLYCEMIRQILLGESNKKAILNNSILQIKDNVLSQETELPIHFWEKLENAGTQRAENLTSSGYVLDSLQVALWGFLQTNTFEDALVAVVNLGDDADTAGAICGGLAGAFYGKQEIPQRWINALRDNERLDACLINFAFLNGMLRP